ncbi:uncharacterized protein LOC131164170 [Malania oleifera]|uniref:uncharacterized protein LOC131164170 n=1 Tax=Malania oleifera TaxID=397392 RepID=UPI0025ADC600|nr:uncharacterized protein LOC131164170 [Malania oleifera]
MLLQKSLWQQHKGYGITKLSGAAREVSLVDLINIITSSCFPWPLSEREQILMRNVMVIAGRRQINSSKSQFDTSNGARKNICFHAGIVCLYGTISQDTTFSRFSF